MRQYCRYCAYALDYNGEGDDFVCLAHAPCGANGAGQMYDASKAKRPNKCKHYEHNGLDIFRVDENGNFVPYKPRTHKQSGGAQEKVDTIQLTLF